MLRGVGEASALLGIVADEQQSHARGESFAQEPLDTRGGLGVERARRLVGEQDVGVDEQGADQRDALALAGGEAGDGSFEVVVEAELGEALPGARFGEVGAVGARELEGPLQGGLDGAVAERGRAREEHDAPAVAGHAERVGAFAVEGDGAGLEGAQSGEGAQDGGLAGPGGPDEGEAPAALDLQRNRSDSGVSGPSDETLGAQPCHVGMVARLARRWLKGSGETDESRDGDGLVNQPSATRDIFVADVAAARREGAADGPRSVVSPLRAGEVGASDGETVTIDLSLDAWGTPLLFVSSRPTAARALEARLGGTGDDVFCVTHVPRWQAALEALEAQEFAAVLLDGDALDVDPGRAYTLLRTASPGTPTFTLTAGVEPSALGRHDLSAEGLDRRDLLRRIKRRRRRAPSRVGGAAPSQGAEAPLEAAIRALARGARPEGLQMSFEAMGPRPGAPVLARVATPTLRPGGPTTRAALAMRLASAACARPAFEWALEEVCDRLEGDGEGWVALPLPIRSMSHEVALQAVTSRLARRQVGSQRLELVMSEADVMEAPGDALVWAAELRLMGAGVAVAGVGAASSSFSVLSRLRATRLEVDASLVAAMHSSDGLGAVAAIGQVARALGATPSAAGVEHEFQGRHLEALGFKLLRGAWLAGG